MRLWERAAARARLPLKFTQGFNPRPKLCWALARPVGVSSRCELLVIEFSRDVVDPSWTDDLGEQLPAGLSILRAEPLPPGKPPRAKAATYEMHLEAPEQAEVSARLAELGRMEKWQVLRRRPGRQSRATEIKDRIRRMGVEANRLCFVLLAGGPGAGGPADVLTLLGFENHGKGEWPSAGLGEAMARLRRTDLECDL